MTSALTRPAAPGPEGPGRRREPDVAVPAQRPRTIERIRRTAEGQLPRFTWDGSTRVLHLSAEAAALLALDRAGDVDLAMLRSRFAAGSVDRLARLVAAAHVGDVVETVLEPVPGVALPVVRLRGIVSPGDHGGVAVTGTLQDLDDEARSADGVRNVTRALSTLSQSGRVLATADSAQALLQGVCESVVMDGGYRFAWYGVVEHDDARSIRPVAWAGHEEGYLAEQRFSWADDDPAGDGPAGRAVRTGQAAFVHRVDTHPTMGPWREAALARGYVSGVGLPVVVEGVVHGCLVVYAAEPTAFDAQEVALLGDLALFVAMGLGRMTALAELHERTVLARASRDRLQATMDSLRDPFMLLEAVRDASGHVVDLRHVESNAAAAETAGLSREEYLARTMLEIYPGLVSSPQWAAYLDVIEHRRPLALEAVPYANEVLGSVRYYDLHGAPCGDGLALTVRDVTERHESRRRLAESEQRYRLLAENASDIVALLDDDQRLVWVSPSVSASTLWTPEGVVGRTLTELVHGDDIPDVMAAMAAARGVGVTFRLRRGDGTYMWVFALGRWATDEDGTRLGYVVGLRDVDEAVQARTALEHAREHDALTGLGTRPTTVTALAETLARTAPDETVAVLAVGIDRLRPVNDALSHEAGDRVIVTVASRVAAAIGPDDVLGRGTGDEFVVVLTSLDSAADAGVVAERIRARARGPVAVGVHRVDPTLSIGIATGDGRSTAEDLLRDADLAMQEAKARGRDRVEFADPVAADEARRRFLVDGAVRDALRDGELVAMFMPIVRLSDGAVTSYEALVRWVRPDGTTVEPSAFLPVAERTDLVSEIDLVVLRDAVRALAALPDDVTVAVNVSTASLARPDYAGHVLEALSTASVRAERLHLEVTETAVLRITEQVRSTMLRLAGAGCRWFMDDFGTGYSSISHLRDLPIAGMKLDRSFTAGLGDHDLPSDRLAQALGGLAAGLGLDTVAEGVETAEQAALLASYGWRHGQGWLYGKAAPLDPPPTAP
ncbi:MAG: EAL domain-containing protein [Frankiales bacterium]|nr:EAL domain-containing protein [Frankiales bacterium]